MDRRRRRLAWTIRWYFNEFKKYFCCGCWKKNDIEIPMSLISPSDYNIEGDGNREDLGSTPFLSSLPKLLQSPNTSLTSCVHCGRVFPDFFHGIRVFYRQGPWGWTCGRCCNAAATGAPTTPIVVIPSGKSVFA